MQEVRSIECWLCDRAGLPTVDAKQRWRSLQMFLGSIFSWPSQTGINYRNDRMQTFTRLDWWRRKSDLICERHATDYRQDSYNCIFVSAPDHQEAKPDQPVDVWILQNSRWCFKITDFLQQDSRQWIQLLLETQPRFPFLDSLVVLETHFYEIDDRRELEPKSSWIHR